MGEVAECMQLMSWRQQKMILLGWMDFMCCKEFMNFFPNRIAGIPLKRDINFTFELVPGAAPVSHTPCRMNIP